MVCIQPDWNPYRAPLYVAWRNECSKQCVIARPVQRTAELFEVMKADDTRRREILERATTILPFPDFLAAQPQKKVQRKGEKATGSLIDVYA